MKPEALLLSLTVAAALFIATANTLKWLLPRLAIRYWRYQWNHGRIHFTMENWIQTRRYPDK